MMLGWMAYTITVSALLMLAAFGAEQVALARRAAGRWIWAIAIAASLALPAAMPSVSIAVPALPGHGGPAATVPLRALASPALTPRAWAPRPPPASATRPDTDRLLQLAWMAVSAAMLAALAGGAAWVSWRKRRWTECTIAGARVHVSEDVGPAVVGLLRHRIVVPAWLLRAPAPQQALVIAHERSHLAAGDPQLLTLALLALVAMPWNLPLWWQLRRLRLAVEVDCDARVLAQGHDRQRYGAALIDAGARQSAFVGSAAAMAASRSSLEHRIGIMVRLPARWKRRAAPALAALSLCMVALAARVGPPDLAHHAVALPAALLQSYAGYYQLDEHRVMIVVQAGDNLSASTNMVRRMVLFPESETGFFMRDQDIQVSFVRPPAGGAATGLVLRQHGVTYPTAPRVGADAVDAADDFVAQRYAQQQAVPGGEQILRRNLDAAIGAPLHLDDFTPECGQVSLRMQPMVQARFIQKYGKVESIRFAGVNRVGWDMYRVQYQHGVLFWHLWFNAAGKVSDVVALDDHDR